MQSLSNELRGVIENRLHSADPQQILAIASMLCAQENGAAVATLAKGPQPAQRFLHGDGVVRDTTTGLMWTHENVGKKRYTWSDAKAAAHWLPIGSLRVNSDGYLDRKVRDKGLPQRRWEGVHRLLWRKAHGPIPRGHAVAFRAGRRTTDLDKITLDALELVSRQELMRRNSYHTNYPKEIGLVIQLRAALVRQINRRERASQ